VVLRADHGRIVIGRGSNVQDNATLHVPENGTTIIKDNVTIGHGAVLEGCVIENGALIGMNAVVLQNATVGEQAILAAGSVATEGMRIPPRMLAAGVPARVKKELQGSSAHWISMAAATYRELAVQHREAVNALQFDGEKG
jgi:carbonic anhydrase/acetyltransferase-like protein (isoleucine patch superfamily)